MLLFMGCEATREDEANRISAETKKTEMFTLQYAVAAEVCEELKSLLGDSASPSVVADERTNSIIVMGSPEEIGLIKETISKLDKKAPVGAE